MDTDISQPVGSSKYLKYNTSINKWQPSTISISDISEFDINGTNNPVSEG